MSLFPREYRGERIITADNILSGTKQTITATTTAAVTNTDETANKGKKKSRVMKEKLTDKRRKKERKPKTTEILRDFTTNNTFETSAENSSNVGNLDMPNSALIRINVLEIIDQNIPVHKSFVNDGIQSNENSEKQNINNKNVINENGINENGIIENVINENGINENGINESGINENGINENVINENGLSENSVFVEIVKEVIDHENNNMEEMVKTNISRLETDIHDHLETYGNKTLRKLVFDDQKPITNFVNKNLVALNNSDNSDIRSEHSFENIPLIQFDENYNDNFGKDENDEIYKIVPNVPANLFKTPSFLHVSKP